MRHKALLERPGLTRGLTIEKIGKVKIEGEEEEAAEWNTFFFFAFLD